MIFVAPLILSEAPHSSDCNTFSVLLVFIAVVVQFHEEIHHSPLYSFQLDCSLPMLVSPEMGVVLHVRSHKNGVEGQNHLP